MKKKFFVGFACSVLLLGGSVLELQALDTEASTSLQLVSPPDNFTVVQDDEGRACVNFEWTASVQRCHSVPVAI